MERTFFKLSNPNKINNFLLPLFRHIIEGDVVLGGNLPWHTVLEDSNCGTLCGGAIINTKFILTAAHCVDSFKKHPQISCPGKLSKLPKVLSYPANIISKFYLGI